MSLQRDNNADDRGETVTAEKIAGSLLTGLMRVVGYSVLAAVAGYAAGVAFDNCLATRGRSFEGTPHR